MIKNSNFINLNNSSDFIYNGYGSPIVISGLSSNIKEKDMITTKIKPIEDKIDATLPTVDQNGNRLYGINNPIYQVLLIHEPDYIDEEIICDDEEEDSSRDLFGEPMDDDDPLYDQALEIVVQAGKASASYIQRKLKIGYNRAARLVEEMEERGIVGPANGSKPREIIHIP